LFLDIVVIGLFLAKFIQKLISNSLVF